MCHEWENVRQYCKYYVYVYNRSPLTISPLYLCAPARLQEQQLILTEPVITNTRMTSHTALVIDISANVLRFFYVYRHWPIFSAVFYIFNLLTAQ